jgi:hypothetical protein
MRTSINATGVSPSLMVYCEQIAVPSLMFTDNEHVTATNEADFVTAIHQHWRSVRDHVMTNDPVLSGPDDQQRLPLVYPSSHHWLFDANVHGARRYKPRGPYRVTDFSGPNITLEIDGELHKVAIDRCKPANHIHDEDDNNEPVYLNHEEADIGPLFDLADAEEAHIGLNSFDDHDATADIGLDSMRDKEPEPVAAEDDGDEHVLEADEDAGAPPPLLPERIVVQRTLRSRPIPFTINHVNQ